MNEILQDTLLQIIYLIVILKPLNIKTTCD